MPKKVLEFFIISFSKSSSIKNLYTIRYEDLFDDNYQKLRDILDSIGLEYTDRIFDNSKYRNEMLSGLKLLDYKPKITQHGMYRTWQINQPFISNNVTSKLDLTAIQKNELLNNDKILTIYPDINC